jgi:hypothetical protein
MHTDLAASIYTILFADQLGKARAQAIWTLFYNWRGHKVVVRLLFGPSRFTSSIALSGQTTTHRPQA